MPSSEAVNPTESIKKPSEAAWVSKKTAPRSKKKKDEVPVGLKRRRQFIWTSVFSFIGVWTLATVRFFFPRTLFEPRTRFRIGYPPEFGFGVSTKFQSQYRVWVVRNAEGIYVLLAKCTHLGCTPDWKESDNKFKCPCHGSGFTIEGVNFEGPAPRPLDRVHVELNAEGRIVVDKARLYRQNEWKKPGAFLLI